MVDPQILISWNGYIVQVIHNWLAYIYINKSMPVTAGFANLEL
jgi:hypothetical protein